MTASDEPTGDRRVPSNQDVINSIETTLGEHVDEYHAFKADELVVMVGEHNALIEAAERNRKTLGRVEGYVVDIIDTIHGEPEKDIDGVVHREGGLVYRVKKLEQAPTPSTTLSTGDRVTLYVAAIGGVSAVIVAIVSSVG